MNVKGTSILKSGGFLFWRTRCRFGLLTKEAVILFQKTFNLNIDWQVGPKVVTALKKITQKKWQNYLYGQKTWKSGIDSPREFEVKKSAWQAIPGQGNPHQIYPVWRYFWLKKLCWFGISPYRQWRNLPLPVGLIPFYSGQGPSTNKGSGRSGAVEYFSAAWGGGRRRGRNY